MANVKIATLERLEKLERAVRNAIALLEAEDEDAGLNEDPSEALITLREALEDK